MANLAFFKENGAFPKAQELESFEKFKADCTPAFRAELKFEVFSELKSMLVTRGELEARIFEENTKMKTQRLEEVISRSEEKLEKATKDWADSEKEMSELKKRQKKPDLTDEEKSQVGREINQVMFKQERIPKVKIITELIRNTKDEIEKLKVSSFQFYISSMDLFKLDDSNVDVSTQWENYYQEFLKNLDGSTGGFNLIDTMTKEAFFKEHGHFPEDSDPAFEAFKKTNSSYLHAQAEFSEFVRVKERQGARERTTEQLRDLVKLESELFDKKQNLQIPLIQASIEIAKNNLETAARNRRVLEDTSREADKRRKKNELKEILKTELKGAIDSARREIGNSTGIAMERKNQLESVILDARRKLEEKNFPEYIRKEKSRISDELRLAQNKLNLIEKSTTVEQRFSNSEFMEQLSIVNDLTRRLWLDPKNLTQFEDDERKKLRETIRSSSEELGNISTFVQARIGELSETIKQTTNTIFEPELLDAAYEKEKNRLWAIYSNANSELEHSTNPRKTAELILKQEKEIKELQTMGNQLRIAAEIVGNDNFKLDSTIPSTEVDFTNLLECLFESPTFRTEFDPLLNDLMQRTNTQVSSPGILRQLDFKKEQKVEVFLQKVAEFLSVSEVSNDGQAQRHLSVWLEKVLSSDPELISKINNSPEIQNNLFRMFCQRCIEVKKDEAKSQNIRGLPMGILEKRLQTESAQMKKLADYPQLSPSNNAQKQKKWQEGKEKLETGLSRVKLDVRESHAQDILYTRQQDQIKQRKEAFENMRATLSVTINKLSEIDRALENAIGGKENLKMDSPMSQKYLVVNSRLRELQVVQADLVKAQEQFKIDSGNYGSRKLSMDEFYTASKEASIQLRTCVSETHRLHHAIRPELTEIPKFFPTVKGLKDLIRSALNSFRDFFDKNPSYTQKTDKAVEKAFTELETAGKKIDTRLKKEGIVTEPENASPNLKKS